MEPPPLTRRRNLDALLEIAGTGLFTMDPEMRIQSMNGEAERLLGLTPGQGLGMTCRDVLGPHICAPDCAFRRTLSDEVPHLDQAVRVSLRDGSERQLVISTAFLEASDPAQREVAVALRDVTTGEAIRKALRERWIFHGLVCASLKMKAVTNLVRELAPYDSTVLILGESGTGKELVARAIHTESPRKELPFVTVNCSAYSESLLESELFGHVRGAFTGAVRERRGRFEDASGGTVFLDEIGEVPASIQVKLLRVLQEKTVERVGDQKSIPVDIRIVAATNRDLGTEVREGRFREDLFYRLNVIAIDIPPLRSRPEDVPALVDHFLARYSRAMGKGITSVSEDALEALLRHDWPGNVREVENALEHAVVRCRGPIVLARDLPLGIHGANDRTASQADREVSIEAAMDATGGNIPRAAKMLGVHRTTLWRWLKKRDRKR